MSARTRLDRDDCIEVVARLEGLAEQRGALAGRLRRLGQHLATQPEDAATFPLLAAAQAVDPDHPEPVTAFREFRRTMADMASGHDIDLAIVVDGQKRADVATRRWWMEGTDPTDRRLRDLSAASTASSDGPVIPSFGRPERDGKTVVRTYFDIAPADAVKAGPCIDQLLTRLGSDKDFVFEPIPLPPLSTDIDQERRQALEQADLVVVFLSPAYLLWSRDDGRRLDDPFTVGRSRVAPVRWSELNERNDLGPYGRLRLFPDGHGRGLSDTAGAPGLDQMRVPRLDQMLMGLHRELGKLLTATVIDPMNELARDLAQCQEPDPVGLRARPTQLDKGIDPASAHGGPTVEVVDHLLSWATDRERRPYFVVFGEYGMGKTVAAQTLTRRLLDAGETDGSVPLPIYFDLRVLGTEIRKRDATLEEILTDLIKRAWRTGHASTRVTSAEVVHAVQQRRAVVIFDGLDEVLVHMSEQQGQGFLRELLRILPPELDDGPHASGNSGKVVLTCRTHFFRTLRDQHTYFRGQDRDVPHERYEALHLLPFDEAQVLAYLEKKQGAAGVDKAIELIRSVHDLTGLASRSYNLRLICEQLERLERRVAESGTIDAAALYDELVQSWLERDNGKHQFDRQHKVELMEDLAALLWGRRARWIEVAELESWLRSRLVEEGDLARWVQLARPDPALLAEDLRTATFIVRPNADEFEFAHTSLLEYFLARYLHRTMATGQATAWRLPVVSPETLDFLVEMAGAADSDDFLRHLTACGAAYQPQVSEAVVRYALRAAEQGGKAPSLRSFQLPAAQLRGLRASGQPRGDIDMTGCNLAGADLRDAVLHRVNLDQSDLRGARLARAELQQCSLRSVIFAEATIDGCIVRTSSMAFNYGTRVIWKSGQH